MSLFCKRTRRLIYRSGYKARPSNGNHEQNLVEHMRLLECVWFGRRMRVSPCITYVFVGIYLVWPAYACITLYNTCACWNLVFVMLWLIVGVYHLVEHLGLLGFVDLSFKCVALWKACLSILWTCFVLYPLRWYIYISFFDIIDTSGWMLLPVWTISKICPTLEPMSFRINFFEMFKKIRATQGYIS